MLLERPLSPGEQLLIRDRLRTTGRTAGLVGALWVTATAGGYLLGNYVLGPLVGHTSYTLDHLRAHRKAHRG
jgi:hypothetical protein